MAETQAAVRVVVLPGDHPQGEMRYGALEVKVSPEVTIILQPEDARTYLAELEALCGLLGDDEADGDNEDRHGERLRVEQTQ